MLRMLKCLAGIEEVESALPRMRELELDEIADKIQEMLDNKVSLNQLGKQDTAIELESILEDRMIILSNQIKTKKFKRIKKDDVKIAIDFLVIFSFWAFEKFRHWRSLPEDILYKFDKGTFLTVQLLEELNQFVVTKKKSRKSLKPTVGDIKNRIKGMYDHELTVLQKRALKDDLGQALEILKKYFS